jgi:hypothetical protein
LGHLKIIRDQPGLRAGFFVGGICLKLRVAKFGQWGGQQNVIRLSSTKKGGLRRDRQPAALCAN